MRHPWNHDHECDTNTYEGGVCSCDFHPEHHNDYDRPVYGETPSTHDGRTHGPALDW